MTDKLPVVSKDLFGVPKERLVKLDVKEEKDDEFPQELDDEMLQELDSGVHERKGFDITLKTYSALPNKGSLVIPYELYATYNFGYKIDSVERGLTHFYSWLDEAKLRDPSLMLPKNCNFRVSLDVLDPKTCFFKKLYVDILNLDPAVPRNRSIQYFAPVMLSCERGWMIGLSGGNIKSVIELADLEKRLAGLDAREIPFESKYSIKRDGKSYYPFNADYIPLHDKMRVISQLGLYEILKNHKLDGAKFYITEDISDDVRRLFNSDGSLKKKLSDLSGSEVIDVLHVLVSNLLLCDEVIKADKSKGKVFTNSLKNEGLEKLINPYGVVFNDMPLYYIEKYGYKPEYSADLSRLYLPILKTCLKKIKDNPRLLKRDLRNVKDLFTAKQVFPKISSLEIKSRENQSFSRNSISGVLFPLVELSRALEFNDTSSLDFLYSLSLFLNDSNKESKYDYNLEELSALDASGEFGYDSNGVMNKTDLMAKVHVTDSEIIKSMLLERNLSSKLELDMEALNILFERNKWNVEYNTLLTLDHFGSEDMHFWTYGITKPVYYQRCWPNRKSIPIDEFRLLFNYLVAPEIEANFKLLGLKPGVSEDEIRTAWKNKLFELHPDTSSEPLDYNKFQDVVDAKTKLMMTKIDKDSFNKLDFLGRPLDYLKSKIDKMDGLLPASF